MRKLHRTLQVTLFGLPFNRGATATSHDIIPVKAYHGLAAAFSHTCSAIG